MSACAFLEEVDARYGEAKALELGQTLRRCRVASCASSQVITTRPRITGLCVPSWIAVVENANVYRYPDH